MNYDIQIIFFGTDLNILLTGATGFIGRQLLVSLLARDRYFCSNVRVAVRTEGKLPQKVDQVLVGNLQATTRWQAALDGVDVVVHCAARTHVARGSIVDRLAEFRETNVEATLNLAIQAAEASVRRFIFMSSIKVNGETTSPGQVFTAYDRPAPVDAYGISKAEAETGLIKIARQTGMEVVIIRPPLVYGPGVKGNFLDLMKAVYKGFPLPFKRVCNRRSMVALDNLVNLVLVCLDHPKASDQIFLAGDGEDISTADLLAKLADAFGKPARLFPVPVSFMQVAAYLFGKQAIAQRVFENLQVDIQKTRDMLGWVPPVSLDDGLKLSADSFIRSLSG